jgi:hypothetical protein
MRKRRGNPTDILSERKKITTPVALFSGLIFLIIYYDEAPLLEGFNIDRPGIHSWL